MTNQLDQNRSNVFIEKTLIRQKKNKTADAERYNVKKNHEFPKYRTKKE